MKVAWLCNYNLNYLKDQINTDLSGYQNHPSTWIYYLAEELAANKNIELHLLTMSFFLEKDIFVEKNGIKYSIFGAKPKRSANALLNFILKFKRHQAEKKVRNRIERKLKENSPDIINIHGTELFCAIEGYSDMVRKTGIPALLWMQGVLNIVYRDLENSYTRVLKKNEGSFFKQLDYFVSKKGNMEDEIKRFNPSPVFFNVFYPVANECFKLYTVVPDIKYDLVFAGSLIQRKGIEDFIRIVGIIKEKNPGISAVAVGHVEDEAYKTKLLSLVQACKVEDNFVFAGELSGHHEVLFTIKNAKILVLPTYADTAPVVVAEAMSMGVPVVAYDVDGLPGMIENGKNGILVEKANINALAAAVTGLLHDPEKRKKITENAFIFAREEFYCPEIAAKTAQIYKEVIQMKKTAL